MVPETTRSPKDDPALQAPPIDTSPGSGYADETRCFQGIPSIECTKNGRLWAAWYAGGLGEGPLNYVVLATRADARRTWSGPKLVIDPPGQVRAFDQCLWIDPQGRLWLFWAQSYQRWDGRAGVWAILTDEPESENPAWSAPHRLCNGMMINKPTVLSTGEWLLPAAVWNFPPDAYVRRKKITPDPAYTHDLSDECGSNVICSTDRGVTWTFHGQARVPETHADEHMIVERRDGSLWMLVRTMYGIGEATSTDRGKTWRHKQSSAIDHIPDTRFFIRRLASGRLLLVKHNPPEGVPRSHLTAYLSDDDGMTWHGGLLLDERDGVSYPDGAQAPDGTIYVVYDYHRHEEKQILTATITEEDIAQGACASDRARLRALVNQAKGRNLTATGGLNGGAPT